MSGEHRIRFGTLHPDGTVTEETTLKQADVLACPHAILEPRHYWQDGSCRCTDPDHLVMESWGYRWERGRWR